MASEKKKCVSADPKINIRLLEKRDAAEAKNVIWELIYLHTSMDIIQDKFFRKRFLIIYSLCGLFGYLDQYLYTEAFLCFITLPCMLFYFFRNIFVPLKFASSHGNGGDFYQFWSQTNTGRRLWVAELDGKLAGTFAIDKMSPSTAVVFRVCVKKRYRGMGIAKKLLETALRHCKSHGIDHVVLQTSYMQVAAQMLYERCGFTVVHCEEQGPFPHYLFGFCLLTYHFSPSGLPPGLWSTPEGVAAMYH